MKEYPTKYERVFDSKHMLCHVNIDRIGNNTGVGMTEYAKNIRELIIENQLIQFDFYVKIAWLIKKFTYKGRESRFNNGSIIYNNALKVFLNQFAGCDFMMISKSFVYPKIKTYLNDFFPNFYDGNPFKVKHEFPYKNITFEYLVLVYQMDERLDLLKIAEDRKMNFVDFREYIINYVGCRNDEINDNKYEVMRYVCFPLYVKNNHRI